MRAFVSAVIVLTAIAVGAHFALKQSGFSTAERAAGPSVRLGGD